MIKYILFSFILCTTYVVSVNAMETNDEKSITSSRKIILEKKKSHLKNYETYLICTASDDIQRLTQINFDIYEIANQTKIGEILLQYYPQGGYYQTSTAPTLRLRHIEIEEKYRHKHHATRALETLFRELRTPSCLKNAEVWLEYSSYYPYLKKLYESFGFKETTEPSFGETKVLKVKVTETKFPYFQRSKAKTKSENTN